MKSGPLAAVLCPSRALLSDVSLPRHVFEQRVCVDRGDEAIKVTVNPHAKIKRVGMFVATELEGRVHPRLAAGGEVLL